MRDSLFDGVGAKDEFGERTDDTVTVRRLTAVRRAVCHSAPVTLGVTVVALYFTLFLTTSWRIGDEGSIVYGAQRVTNGEVPYRDFFEVMGPGSFYWLALWFKVLGTSWVTSRLAVLATALASACAIYYMAARHCNSRFAPFPAVLYAVVTIPLWPGASHHLDSNLWALLAIAAVGGASQLSTRRAVIAGLFAGFSSTIMPQKGVLIFAALMLSVALQRGSLRNWRRVLSRIGWMASAFAAVGVSVLVFFWSQGALDDLLYANVVWPATRYHSVNVMPYGHGLIEWFLPSWSSVIRAVLPWTLAVVAIGAVLLPFAFIASLPVMGLLLSACRAIAPRHPLGRELPLTYVLAGFALFVSECHRPDIVHLIYGSPVLAVLVTLALAKMPSRGVVIARRALVGCLALVAMVLALIASMAQTTVETRRGVVHMFDRDEALDFLQTHVAPDENVFVYPYYPMYYFLANIRNPTRYSILMYHINTEDQFNEVIDALHRERVRFVLWDTFVAGENLTRWFPAYRHPPAEQQLLERYLTEHYRVVGIKNRFRILERVESSP